MLTSTYEDNWTFSCGYSTQSSTALSMTIQFSYNNRANFDRLIKSLSLIKASLSNRTVHHEESCIWGNGCLHLLHFFEESDLLFVSSWGIHYDYFKFLLFEECDTFLSYLDWICLHFVPKEWTLYLSSIHLQLFESTSSESICTYQSNSPSLLHIVIGKFSAGSCLTRSLQTHKHDYILFTLLELIRLYLSVEHIRQFFNHSPLNQFPHIRASFVPH